MINSSNNISSSPAFKGGFLLKNPSAATKKRFLELVPTQKFVHEDLFNPGDFFVAVRNAENLKCANFIKENKLPFEFYPLVNLMNGFLQKNKTKEGFCNREMFSLKIDNLSDMFKNIFKQNRSIKQVTGKYTDFMLDALSLDKSSRVYRYPLGDYHVFAGTPPKRVAYFAPSLGYGSTYAVLESKDPAKAARLVSIGLNGNIKKEYESPNERSIFYRGYYNTIEKFEEHLNSRAVYRLNYKNKN